MKQTTTPITGQSQLLVNTNPSTSTETKTPSTKSYELQFEEATGKNFNQFYKEYYPKLLWQIKKLKIDHLDADFITTEAFMHSLTQIEKYDSKYAYSTWLFHMAKNIALQHKKKAAKIVLVDSGSDDSDMDSPEAGINYYVNNLTKVDDELDNNEYEKKVARKYNLTLKAIAGLKDKYKDIVKLCDVDKKTYLEIVEITGLPMQTVKNRVFHGRNKIIESLKKEFNYINNMADMV